MCYHVSFEIKLESITDYFPDLIIDPQLEIEHTPAAYLNGFDHPNVSVMVKGRKDGKRHLPSMMWGFVPDYIRNFEEAQKFWNGYKDEKGGWHKGFVTLNAIGEQLLEKKLYREAALNRRCVIFIDGFYEWTHVYPAGKKGQPLKTAIKYPHYISINDDGAPFMMAAGIWTPWKHTEVDKDTGEVITFTTPCFAISTTAANEKMARIHNSKERMPTFLTRELAEEWIEDGLSEERIVQLATNQYSAASMKAYSIDQDFQKNNNPKEAKSYQALEGMFAEMC